MNFKISVFNKIPKKICAIHDLSCFGRCALTVIIPILSQLGHQVIPLPTALLSTHTGGFSGFTFHELTEDMQGIKKHLQAIDKHPDCIYSGFLGDEKQIKFVLDFVNEEKERNTKLLFFADPVMGDDGQKYSTYTDEMCNLTKKIAEKADILTPNLTEACLLLDIPYQERFAPCEIENMLFRLSNDRRTSVVITGILEDNKMGAYYFDRDTRTIGKHMTECLETSYPGTGDAFASVLLGCLLKDANLSDATLAAVNYVFSAIELTSKMGTPIREGVLLESINISAE